MKSVGQLCIALLILSAAILSPSVASAQSTLAEYRARIHEAAIALDSLAASGEDRASAANERAVMARTLEQIRARVPTRERVALRPGDEFETDNRWLHEALSNFAREDFITDSGRAAALTLIAERLRAVADRLAEVESSSDSAANEREEMRDRLELILRRAEYNEGTRGQSALSRFGEWLLEQLRKILPRFPRLAPGGGVGGALVTIVQVVIVALVIALVAFLVWKLAPVINNRRRARRARAPKARVILGETIEADKSAADLLAEAEQWAREGDPRAAIRKAYIATLCELGDRKILPLAGHKTNRDYLRDTQPHPTLYNEMQPLTFNFERHWYGFQPASETDWQNFRERCRKAVIGDG